MSQEEVAHVYLKVGEHRAPGEQVIGTEQPYLPVGRIRRDATGAGVDHPHQAGASVQVVSDLGIKPGSGVARRDHLRGNVEIAGVEAGAQGGES